MKNFAADLDRISTALESGGWIVTLSDGSEAIDAGAPAGLVRAYQGLMEYGYANGLFV